VRPSRVYLDSRLRVKSEKDVMADGKKGRSS
jgi:hypothetical protein